MQARAVLACANCVSTTLVAAARMASRLRLPDRLGSLRRRRARRRNLAEWFFTSDLHGSGELYEQVMSLAAARRPRAVILGGDLAPHGTGAAGVGHQRVFLEGFLVEFARRLRDSVPGAELLVMMGNDDWGANHDVLERHDGALWR